MRVGEREDHFPWVGAEDASVPAAERLCGLARGQSAVFRAEPARRAAMAGVALLALANAPAWACRVRVIDPFHELDPGATRPPLLQAIYLGEITGVRHPARLDELRRCRPQGEPWPPAQDEAAPVRDCGEPIVRSNEYEVDLWPTEILLGKTSYPARVRISGCLTRAPQLGAVAVVPTTSEGWTQLRLREGDDPDYGWAFDAAWLARLQACIRDRNTCGEASAR